ncbi:signal peptidase I [bacterium]|nr:MAG: signal peptidase I [bacterium]
MKKLFLFFWEFIQIIFISLIIIIPIRYYIIQPFFVKGSSMEPSFQDGNYLIIDELTYHLRAPKRGEVMVFHFPQNTKQFYIKRIIGLPGETIKISDGQVLIINKEYPDGFVLSESNYIDSENTPGNIEKKLDNNSYFMMGDNRLHSSDSRSWGELEKKYIVGKVLFRIWPFEEAKTFSTPSYKLGLSTM